jgi:hypothetical protein
MRSLPPTSIARLVRRASVLGGVIAAAAVVACSDSSTAPHPTSVSVPSGADANIVPLRSLVTVKVTLYNGTLFAYDKASVKFIVNGDSGTVKDNTAFDKDTTTGIISALVPGSATVKVCLTSPPKDWNFSPKEACNTVPGGTAKVDAGALIIHNIPALGLYMWNMSGNAIPGGQFTITGPPGSGYSQTITDGDANDRYAGVNGKIVLWVPAPGTYKWCEKTPPPGYLMTLPQCGLVDLVWDFGITVDVKHYLKLNGLPF